MDVNIQSQNFNAPGDVGEPSQPKSNKVLIVVSIILLALIVAVGLYWFVFRKPVVSPVVQPQILTPQAQSPQTPTDSVSDIESDLNAVNLNDLDKGVQTDITNIGGSL